MCGPCSLPVALFTPVPPVSPVRNIDSLPTLCYPHWSRPRIDWGRFITLAGDARIPYDDLPILDYALPRVIWTVEELGRLGAALRRVIVMYPVCRLGKIEAPSCPAPGTGTEDSQPERLPQSLYSLVRLIGVCCLSPVAQGAGRRDPAGSLLLHHIAIEKFTPFSNRAQTPGTSFRFDRRRRPSTRRCPVDVGRVGSEENPVGSRDLSI